MRQSWETITSVSAGHNILTPTQPVGSGRPQRESNPEPSHQESRSLPTEPPLKRDEDSPVILSICMRNLPLTLCLNVCLNGYLPIPLLYSACRSLYLYTSHNLSPSLSFLLYFPTVLTIYLTISLIDARPYNTVH